MADSRMIFTGCVNVRGDMIFSNSRTCRYVETLTKSSIKLMSLFAYHLMVTFQNVATLSRIKEYF